ncbi:somatostatin receptor type 5 [Pseudoliparis swirei]|uniref:somatostatin receptor type 5 n=1 Tax=Pseudoliparis swirei TaxID=2059687 RepID=UPI0024BE8526|nr:somatostatin receptor type 5 [Pseudoliparis swirei]
MFNATAANATAGPAGPPPWYQFPVCAAAPWAFVFYFGVKVLNLAVGAPGNALVIWRIGSGRSDATTSDVFILNLAVLDGFFCLMTPVDMGNRLLLDDQRVWYLQRFSYGLKDLAPLFLVCICLDRYVAVVHPLLFTRIRGNAVRVAASAAVWVLVLVYGLAKSTLGVASVSEVFGAAVLSALCVMLFCNVAVVWALRRCVAGKEALHPVKRRALRTVLTALAIVVALYLPPVALMPFASYYGFVVFRCRVSVSVFAIMDLSCSVEPLLFIARKDRAGGGGGCCGRHLPGDHAPEL